MKNQYELNEDEKSRILNLHEEATKRQYLTLNEQTVPGAPNFSMKNNANVADNTRVNLNYNNPFKTTDYFSEFTTTTTTVASVVVDTTTKKPYVAPKPNPIITDLQTTINAKTQSGLKEDGLLGKKTINAIYNALVGTSTTQTTTVAPQPSKDVTGTTPPSKDK
jgi:hypothetical protein